jgi:hypothetical protein
MKSILNKLVISAALLYTAGVALEAQTFGLYATIPFGWQVQGRTLAAGQYSITHDGNTPYVVVRNKADQTSTVVAIGSGSERNSTNKLVFHQYGSQYFLAEISGTKLHMTKAEKEVMESEKPRQMATIEIGVRPAL